MDEGSVVIVNTSQAGTYIGGSGETHSVLLANGCIWYGRHHEMRKPQSQEDLDAAILDVDRFENR